MPDHVVKQGECLSLIAKRYGFKSPLDIWNDGHNQALRDKRKGDFNVLFPGDVLFIPERNDKQVAKPTRQAHTFTVKLPPKKVLIFVRNAAEEPVAGADYVLEVGGERLTGKTDGQGKVEQTISTLSTSGKLTVGKYHWDLDIGHLNPIVQTPDEGISGIQARLKNLGYLFDCVKGSLCEKTKGALKSFQQAFGLSETGQPDEATKSKLEQAHRNEAKPTAPKPPPPKPASPAASSAAPASSPAPKPKPSPAGGAGSETATQTQQAKPEAKPQTAAAGASKTSAASSSEPTVKEVDTLPETPALCTAVSSKKTKKAESNPVSPETPNVLKPARKGTCHLCQKHADCLDNDYDFLVAVAQMANRLDGDATGFMGIMHFETGHRYSASIKNPGSGATGLIQFMPSTAKGMGTTTETLGKMCRIEQLEYVERYFKDQKKSYPHADYKKVRDVVLAVFEPVGLKPDYEVLGVSASVCSGPYFDDVTGTIDVTDAMTAYYKANPKLAKGKNIIRDEKGNVVGVNGKKIYWKATYKNKEIRVTKHQRDVYKGNAGLDKDKDGILLRDDYPAIVNGLITGRAKGACDKAHELQGGTNEYQIVPLSALTKGK